MITLSKIGSAWVGNGPYETKDTFRSAGFWWHPGPLRCDRNGCQACKNGILKNWWTSSKDVAAKLAQYADDSCRQELVQFEKKCEESLEASTALSSDIEVPTKLPLFPFQRAGVKFIEDHEGRALLADEMGVGKTPQAIGFLTRNQKRLPAIVVCPASVRVQWTREVSKFSDLSAKILAGNSSVPSLLKLGVYAGDRCDALKGVDVVITNYDILDKNLAGLKEVGFQTLILDEASAIKEPKSKRSKAALALSESIPNVILLSGTPLLNRPKELWNLTQAVDPTVFPKFFGFARKFCAAEQTEWGWNFDGASDLDELNKILRQRIMIRREKKEVLTELPEKVRVTLPIALDKEPREQKKKLAKILKKKAELDDWKKAVSGLSGEDRKTYLARHAERAAQMAGITGVLISEIQDLQKTVAAAKLPAAIDRILEMLSEGQGKLLIFSHHHEVTDETLRRLRSAGVECVRVDGRDGAAERLKAIDALQFGNVRVAVLGIMAAGLGLNLTAANDVVFLELPWRPADVEQAEARVWRLGQESRVTSYFVVAAGTIEETIAKMLDRKREVTSAAMGETDRVLEEQGILDAILDNLKPPAPAGGSIG